MHTPLNVRSLCFRALALAACSLTLLMGLGRQPGSAPTESAPVGSGPVAAAVTSGPSDWATSYSPPVERQARNVAIISIHGEIDGGGRRGQSVMAASVRRRIELAVRSGADALVIDLDTPGGEVGAVIGICDAIKKSGIRNTVAWINPQAYSGGAIIAMACREIVTNDPANMGDAMPIGMGPMGVSAIDNAELKAKVLPPLITEVLDSTSRVNTEAGRYVRDKYLSMAIVANDVELWWVRNNETGTKVAIDRREFEMLFPGADVGGDTRLARIPGRPTNQMPLVDGSGNSTSLPGDPAGSQKLSGVASSLVSSGLVADLSNRPAFSPADVGKWTVLTKALDGTAPATFSAADLHYFNFANNPTQPSGIGTTIAIIPMRTDADIQAFMGATNIRRINRSWSEGFVAFLTSPWIRGLLIAIFLVAIAVEMMGPGLGLPGAIATIAFFLIVVPAALIGMANWWEVGAMVGGILLIALEIFVLPGIGVAGVLGGIFLFAGLVGTFIPPGHGLFPDSPRQQNDMLRGMVVTLLACVTAAIGGWMIVRNLKTIPILNRFMLRDPLDDAEDLAVMMGTGDDAPPVKPGALGVAQTSLRPAGRALFGDDLLDVVADIGFIAPGTSVRVVSATANRIAVEAVPDGQQSG